MRLSVLGFLGVGLVLLSGCSDPVPPTPRGAWTVSFADTGIECQHGGHNAKVGDVGPSTKNAVVVDGTEGANVDCRVSPKGSGFFVDASLQQSDKFLTILIDGISTAATETAPVKGGIGYSSANTVDTYTTTTMDKCDYYFVPSAQGIAAGRVWVSFKCPRLEAEGSFCSIQQGYAIFENCEE